MASALPAAAARHARLRRFRRHTWAAIVLCAALRLADAAAGLGLLEPTPPLAAQDAPASRPACLIEQDFAL